MREFNKIIVYYPSFERGGITKILQNFVNECINKKIDVYLITEGLNWKDNYKVSNKVKIIPIKKFNFTFLSKRIISSVLSINSMISLFSNTLLLLRAPRRTAYWASLRPRHRAHAPARRLARPISLLALDKARLVARREAAHETAREAAGQSRRRPVHLGIRHALPRA